MIQKSLHHLGPASEKTDRQPGLLSGFQKMQHQVWSVNPRGFSGGPATKNPHKRHTVRSDKVGLIDTVSKSPRVITLHHHVHVSRADIAGLTGRCPVHNSGD